MGNIIIDRARYRDGHVEVIIEGSRELPLTSLVAYLNDTGKTRSPQECFWVVAVDGMERVRTVVEIARGSYHEVDIPFPAVFAAVLASGCDRFVVVHNHPTDDVAPTEPDLDVTRKIMTGANAVGLYFDDHIIVSPTGSHYSFTAAGLIAQSPRLLSMSQTNRRVNMATAKSVER